MSNIIKGFNCLFLFLFLSPVAQGQALMSTASFTVNGEVYDVDELNFMGSYYVIVGDFTTVNGQTGFSNIAIIDKDTYTAYPLPYATVDGAIRTVKVHSYSLGPPTFQIGHLIYIGGDFTTVESAPRNGIAKLVFNTLISPASISNFTLHSWDPGFYPGPNSVTDLEKRNDTLYVAGNFQAIDDGLSSPSDYRPGLAAFNIVTSTSLNMFSYAVGCTGMDIWGTPSYTHGIELAQNRILVSGGFYPSGINVPDSYVRFGYDGCYDPDFSPGISSLYCPSCWYLGGYDVAVSADTNYAGIYQLGSGDPSFWSFTDTTNYGPPVTILPQSGNGSNGIEYNPAPEPNTIIEYTEVCAYKDKIFYARSHTYTGGPPYPIDGPNVFSYDSTGINWSAGGLTSDFTDINNEHLFVVDNKLFISKAGTTNIFGESRTGIILYCLEPDDPEAFNVFDTTVCQGDTVLFQIPVVQFADGYEWNFIGGGADLDTLQFGEQSFAEGSNNISIEILESFTSGTLTVTPYSTCNDQTIGGAKVYSKTISINIGLDVLPDANAGLDTLINCYIDTINLVGNSITPGVNYYWNQEFNPLGSNYAGQNYNATQLDNYILKVEAPNGCLNFDTVFVDMDTIKPNFDPIAPDVLGCDETLYFTGFCNNGMDTVSWWEKEGNPTQLPNPLPCSVGGDYWFYTQFTGNGCVDSTTINIIQDLALPNIAVTGYTMPGLGIPLAYISCAIDTLVLEAYSDSANTVVNWVDQDTLNPFGDTQIMADSGYYYIHAIDNDNNCQNFLPVYIGLNITPPQLPVLSTSGAGLNCSNDSLVLTGSTGADTAIWTGSSIVPSSNPVTVFDPGYYTLTVTLNSNGCSSSDSILVTQDNSIDVLVSSDTVGCNQDLIAVNAGYTGNISGITYLWNNGSTASSTSYTAGADNYAIVEINGNGGCYGTDTIFISIPPSPVFSVEQYAPCGVPNSGYLVFNPVSGWAPFEYSLDGGSTYQTSSTLSGLDIGSYLVTIKDSLGCEYDFPAELTDASSPPTPDFLLSTYNYVADTIALVNVSNPAPDSVNWIFPSSIIMLDDNDTLPLLILPDTGAFTITMDAYYGSCSSSHSKVIYVTEFDTTLATLYNNNGIKSVELYPNPNDGNFTVTIEFYKKQSANVIISDMSGVVFESISYIETNLISEQFQLTASAGNGTYVLRIAAEFDSAYITFVLNR